MHIWNAHEGSINPMYSSTKVLYAPVNVPAVILAFNASYKSVPNLGST